ncbi:MAG: sortase [Anaerolineales bacterium]|nr:sortase [Anaerolineales bacterium]
MFGKRKLDDLSVEELEKALLIKRRQSRLERFQRLSGEGRSTNEALLNQDEAAARPQTLTPRPGSAPIAAPGFQTATVQPMRGIFGRRKAAPVPPQARTRSKKVRDALLLGLEVVALTGLVAVLVASYFNLKELNAEVSLAQQSALQQDLPTPTVAPPPITLNRLPGGHTPPTAPGGAAPDVPMHLQQWVQTSASGGSAVPIEVKTAANSPTRIVIPKIQVDAPIINGVTWEDLKKGVGHLPGSANPGERGNLYLAAHNDIFGEIFRYLEKLEVGDEYFIHAGEQKFRYVVKEKRIINPTDVEVMLPTTEPVATLQTCYPYLVDTHRLVVIGELAE